MRFCRSVSTNSRSPTRSLLVVAMCGCLLKPTLAAASANAVLSPSLSVPGSFRFMQTHDTLLRKAYDKYQSENLVQLDKEDGVDYVLCNNGKAMSTQFVASATVTFADEDDRTRIFSRLIGPKTYVSSKCSFDREKLFYGKVIDVEKKSGSPAAVRIAVEKASPQQVCHGTRCDWCVRDLFSQIVMGDLFLQMQALVFMNNDGQT